MPVADQVRRLWSEELQVRLNQLRQNYFRLEGEFESLEGRLARQVGQYLSSNNVTQVITLLDSQPEFVHGQSLNILRDWRRKKFDEADDSRLVWTSAVKCSAYWSHLV